MLRVLHDLGPDAGAADALALETDRLRAEPGCVSAELYRTLAAGEDALALTSLWADETDFWTFWARATPGLVEESPYPALVAAVTGGRQDATTEFYARTPFVLADGMWTPEGSDQNARRIVWPARGEVRIIITNAVDATEAMYAKIRAEIAETRREDGCLSYAWYESVALPGHLMLLEVWADQVVYDRHWALRGATASFMGDNLRVPAVPQRGEVSREFYRRQRFVHHYDRWLPADAAANATTIAYPAS